MKKEIRVKIVGMWSNFSSEKWSILDILRERYNLVECDNPDYIICSVYEIPYIYCQYPQVRIMYSGENYCPDFNLVDYGIGYDDITFGDRYYRFGSMYSLELSKKDRNYSKDVLEGKTLFANFIASHESEYSIRGDFFKKLCEYKVVSSMGTYLNNMPNNKVVAYQSAEKVEYQRKCKFTLCFESTSHLDFCTEKLVNAFLADTIPIYYGDPNVCKTFNSKAFINVADYDSYEAVLEKIKELDNDDEKYLEMLRQPVYVEPDLVEKQYEGLKKWLYAIFDQPLEKAFRRSRCYCPLRHEKELVKKFTPDYVAAERKEKKAERRAMLIQKFPRLKKLYKKIVRH